jgi:protein-tyrosine phosphatase
MEALREAGVDVVVSMLQVDEAAELGLFEERSSALRAGLTFANFPIPDHGVPSDGVLFGEFLELLESQLAQGTHLGIHCRACIGRASIAAASLLIRSGVLPENAWVQIAAARRCPVPDTPEQRAWVDGHMRPNL